MTSPSTILSALACEMAAQGIPYSAKLDYQNCSLGIMLGDTIDLVIHEDSPLFEPVRVAEVKRSLHGLHHWNWSIGQVRTTAPIVRPPGAQALCKWKLIIKIKIESNVRTT
ncbi:hypothetical protein BD769DRAFT_1396904 [Suillus cothurnatus]|nr:hypothetical protein BD769DRAFT_1396904 [Suillus cothurnatus]